LTLHNPPGAIAIDGPAASGKTTIGQMLAEHLGYLFLDTGSMYRAVTLAALQRGIDVLDEEAVISLTRRLAMTVLPPGKHSDGRLYTVMLDGQDVTWELRQPDVDNNVSQVSLYAGVREGLVKRQQAIAAEGKVVMVGRDIGTVVLPEATLKLYIIASPEERALRRWQERKARGLSPDFDQIHSDILRRDLIDGNRKYSPMRPAADAIIIDTTGRTPQAVLDQILTLAPFQTEEAQESA
jgi:cytidylate kinase